MSKIMELAEEMAIAAFGDGQHDTSCDSKFRQDARAALQAEVSRVEIALAALKAECERAYLDAVADKKMIDKLEAEKAAAPEYKPSQPNKENKEEAARYAAEDEDPWLSGDDMMGGP